MTSVRDLIEMKGRELGRQVAVNGVGRVDFETAVNGRFRVTVVADRAAPGTYVVILEGEESEPIRWHGDGGLVEHEENPGPFTWAPWGKTDRRVMARLLDAAAEAMSWLRD